MPRGPASQPALTREQSLEMMDSLIEEYSKVEFQRELHRAWDAAEGDPVQQGRARQAVCLTVQGPIIARYGFEQSRKGVAHSVAAFGRHINPQYEDHFVRHKCFLVGWLVNPAQQRASKDREREEIFASLGLQPPAAAAPAEPADDPQPQQGWPEDTPGASFEHLVPERPLLYGGYMGSVRAPSAFLATPASATGDVCPLMKYLREDPKGPFAGMVDKWPPVGSELAGRWAEWGFDVGANGKEQLLKADWHSVHSWGPRRRVFVPRFGDCISLRRAPPRILAFLEAFREANLHVWYSMVQALVGLKHTKECTKTLEWLVDLICTVIVERSQFGAIEAQVWWGPQSTATRSHKDGATSLLHLSITLGGQRSLRLGTFEKPDSFGPSPWVYSREEWAHWQRFQNCDDSGPPTSGQVMKENNVWDDKAWKQGDLRKIAMSTGDVYLSSPFVFEHGVKYDPCTRTCPIIALQCRMAFQFEKPAFKVNELRDKAMLAVAKVLADTIKQIGDTGGLRLPTLHEVIYWEGRIAEHLETQMAALAGGRYLQNIFHKMVLNASIPAEAGKWPEEECQPHDQSWDTAQDTEADAPEQPDQQWNAGAAVAEQTQGPEQMQGLEEHYPEQQLAIAQAQRRVEAWRSELAGDDQRKANLREILEKKRLEYEVPKPKIQLEKKRLEYEVPTPKIQLEKKRLEYEVQTPKIQLADATQQSPQWNLQDDWQESRIWIAVGGEETGGIVVRKDQDRSSAVLSTRLATGALVEELEVIGHRLHYKKLKGEGPDYGWVTTKVNNTGKVLVKPM